METTNYIDNFQVNYAPPKHEKGIESIIDELKD